jgi:hypothetical protein
MGRASIREEKEGQKKQANKKMCFFHGRPTHSTKKSGPWQYLGIKLITGVTAATAAQDLFLAPFR